MRMRTLAVVALTFACAPRAAPSPKSALPQCPPGFDAVRGNVCLALPEQADADTPVVLFFHGMYAPHSPEQEFASETRFARGATAAGYAVLAPRGELGLCDWSPKFADVMCWPVQTKQRPQVAELFARWEPAFEELGRRLHTANAPTVLLSGFSIGGYMAVVVASETRLPVRALAVLHGGPPDDVRLPADRAVPTLLLSADQDAQFGPDTAALEKLLAEHGWASNHQHHPGTHEIADADVSATFQFFQDVRRQAVAPDDPGSR